MKPSRTKPNVQVFHNVIAVIDGEKRDQVLKKRHARKHPRPELLSLDDDVELWATLKFFCYPSGKTLCRTVYHTTQEISELRVFCDVKAETPILILLENPPKESASVGE